MRFLYVYFILITMLISPAKLAFADIELDLLPNIFDKFKIHGKSYSFFRHDTNPSYGEPVDSKGRTETTFGEHIVKTGFSFESKIGSLELEARVTGVLLTTINGDVYGIAEDESQGFLNEGYLVLKNLLNSSLDITVGRQNIFIEKRFISGDGHPEDAAIWISAQKSFPLAVRIDKDFGKLKTTAFWADTKLYSQQNDQRAEGKRGKEDVTFMGLNLHYDLTESIYVYAGYYRKNDNSNLTFESFSPGGLDRFSENDTNAFDIGFDATIKSFNFAGEFVYQNGDAGQLGGKQLDRDAHAGFIHAKYTFDHSKKPYMKVMFVSFSGDSDLEDDEAGDYDPMFSTFLTWNEWFIGQHVGEVQQPNTNKKALIVETGFTPTEKMQVALMYIKHTLNEKYVNASRSRTALASDDYADEFNLLVDYEVTSYMNAHLGAGYVIPRDAAKEAFGGAKDNIFSQVGMKLHF